MSLDTAPVRSGEQLNLPALARYLCGKIDGRLALRQFPGGHSNLTYLLIIGEREYVLRRAPLGPVPPKAHDMVREARILSAVHPHFAPAPEVYLICEDPNILGSPFFLMERRRGIVLRDHVPPEVSANENFQSRISRAFADCLIELHSIDIVRHNLTPLGHPEGFLARQVKGWSARWTAAQIDPALEMDRILAWLNRTLPVSPEPTLVHNDFKLDNVMIDESSPDRIEAVLDWEMATVGDPLCDLGLTLCYWSSSEIPGTSQRAVTTGPGWWTREQFIAHYAERTGRELSKLAWYEVFGIFKLAVILQQIYFRFVRGQTTDERFRDFNRRVESLIHRAAERIDHAAN